MARRKSDDNRWVDTLTCADGINRQLDAMRGEQCYDARNVWERGGRVVQRPGYSGVTGSTIADGSIANTAVLIKESPLGTFTVVSPGADLDVSSLPVGDRWYVGFDSDPRGACAIAVAVLQSNTAATLYYAEYWNGSSLSWDPVLTDEVNSNGMSSRHLGGVALSTFGLAPSQAWVTTTVSAQTRYFLRFTILNAALDATVSLSNNASKPRIYTMGQTLMLGSAPFAAGRKFYSVVYRPGAADVIYSLSPRPGSPVGRSATYRTRTLLSGAGTAAQLAVVPAAGEMYLALQNEVTMSRWDQAPDNGLSLAEQALAQVETADWAVGENQVPPAPYAKNLVAQLAAFPKANLISFFQNRLWAADIVDEQNVIRWSAPYPYHKVWPALAYEYVDQKPTAKKPLGENQIVYSQDAIYSMVFDSIDDFQIPHFKAIKTVAGRGCVAPNSIQEIDGRHILQSEDGLYAFDGTSNIVKITNDPKTGADRLQGIFERVTSSARQFSASAHWRGQKMYLLSLPVDGSPTNNLTIAWDYARDKFWLWDDIPAQFWLVDNGPNSDETVYFGDSSGRIYQFAAGDTDHGAGIETYVVSRPIGFGDFMHKGLTEVKVLANSAASEMDIEVWPQGISQNAKTGTLEFDDYREAKWGTAIWGTSKWAEPTRRFQHQHYKLDGSWFQLKLIGAAARGKPFEFSQLAAFLFNKYEDTR